MGPGEVLVALHEQTPVEDVGLFWNESMAQFAGGRPPLLDPQEIQESMGWAGIDRRLEPVILRTAERIAADPALVRLAWHGYWRVFDCPEVRPLKDWPSLEASLGAECGIFYFLVGLGMVPRVRRFHRDTGIPEAVTRETCGQVRCYLETYAAGNEGRLGVFVRQLTWMRHYTRERYFRLGRLEYWLRPNAGGPVVFRHRQRGDVLALADEGTQFTDEGYIDLVETPEDTRPRWTATLTVSDDAATGYPISPHGMALHQKVSLPLAEWQRVLAKGDPTLQIHIPSGGGLTPEATSHSVRYAVEFFRRQFPEEHPVALNTGSWIFNPQLDGIFPPTANLVRFLRESYLYPIASGSQSGLWFVFLRDDVHPDTAPRRTSVQRAILDFLAAGNRWRVGGMFILVDDVRYFGTQYYRSRWPPALLRTPQS